MDRPLVFGTLNNLVGIAHIPDAIDRDSNSSTLGVVMLTPGMLHSAGPFRLHVDLADAFGKQGIPSLRFDLSGIGESLGVGSRGDSIQRAVQETRQAMDVMQSDYAVDRFILFGLCSGADDSLFVAQADQRVQGVILLDGLGFRTRRFYAQRLKCHYLPKMFLRNRWKKIACRFMKSCTPLPNSLVGGDDVREFPPRDKAQQIVQALIDRQIQLLCIYTGGASAYFNYERQFDDMFPKLKRNDQVTVKYLPHSDHVAFLCEDRHEVVELCSNWLASHADRLSIECDGLSLGC